MTDTPKHSIAFVGIDIGKNSFHVVSLDECGAIVLRQKWSRGQVEARFAARRHLTSSRPSPPGIARLSAMRRAALILSRVQSSSEDFGMLPISKWD
jgi:hypothetical protein